MSAPCPPGVATAQTELVAGAAWAPCRPRAAGAGLLAHGTSPSGFGAGSHGGEPETFGGRGVPARVIGVSGDLGIWTGARRATSSAGPNGGSASVARGPLGAAAAERAPPRPGWPGSVAK